MPYVIGIDEAGYGPKLGCLVVGCTVWHVESQGRVDFWDCLRDCVARPCDGLDWRLRVGDSKEVFDRKKGLHTLERAVLAFASAAGLRCERLAELLNCVCQEQIYAERAPWYRDLDHELPTDRLHSQFAAIAERLRDSMQRKRTRCLSLMAQVVTEELYIQRLQATRNKAAVLIEQVMKLIDRARALCPADQDVVARIDRLGGRSDYVELLLSLFPGHDLRVLKVSDEHSRYRLSNGRSAWYVEFAVDADKNHLPVALASMVAKYLREVLMARLNAYWKGLLPELSPTAGYYRDAERFIRDIAPVLTRSGLQLEQFVRPA